MNDPEVKVTALERTTSAPIDVAAHPVPSAPSPWRKVHQSLRGRYHWALLLALIGMGGGGYIGWHAQQPIYRGAGLVYIQPSMPSLQDPTGTSVLPMFKGFVALQVQMLQSPRATKMAMETDTWKATGEGMTPESMAAFEERRKILHGRDTQHIQVHFEDPDPDVALAGVQALIQAYQKLAIELNDADERLMFQRTQTEVLTGRIKAVTDQMLAFTTEYGGVEGLEIRHRAFVGQVLSTGEALADIQTAIDNFGTEDGKSDEELAAIPPGEIAVESEQMDRYLLDLDLAKAKEELLAETLGPKDERLIDVRQRITVLEKNIERFALNWNRLRLKTNAGGATRDELDARKRALQGRLASLQERSRRIGQTRVDVDRLQNELDDLNRKLVQIEALKDQLTAQLVGKGRIKIPDPGTKPTAPYRDRRAAYAVAGGGLGGMVGLLIVLLIGLLDRRLKSAGDVDHSMARLKLLGLLPTLPADGVLDASRGQAAAQCVDQMRAMLQIGHDEDEGACICVTAPGVGSGKTTLTTALGLSFGSSGSHTLLVDADLSGRALTRRVGQLLLAHVRKVANGTEDETPSNGASNGVRRSLLEPLMALRTTTDPVNPSELVDLLNRCIDRLGIHGVREAGVVDELFALADLLFSGDGRDELASRLMSVLASKGELTFDTPTEWVPSRVLELDAPFNGTPVEHYMYPTGIDSVRFLPLRSLARKGGVSARTISKIMTQVRAGFDAVLIDTGPVPGTVETSMVAANADSVILVVSPGDRRPDADRAVAHMDEVGANMAGVVFNRADQKEVIRSSMSRSSPYGA